MLCKLIEAKSSACISSNPRYFSASSDVKLIVGPIRQDIYKDCVYINAGHKDDIKLNFGDATSWGLDSCSDEE